MAFMTAWWRSFLSGVVAGGAAILATAGPAAAQLDVAGFSLTGEVEAGVRFLVDEPKRSDRAKFEEYRDFHNGLYLEGLHLRLARPDESYAVEIGGNRWGQDDQEFSLRAGRLGLWEAGFDWTQMQHIFATNARFLGREVQPWFYSLPSPPPPLSAHNAAPEVNEIGVRWDTARIWVATTPIPDLDLTAEYTRIKKDGTRPGSINFGTSPGSPFYNVPEPIDQTIHDFRLGLAWIRERYQLQFKYALSVFENHLTALVVDNPCGPVAAPPVGCGAADANANGVGRLSLAPSNQAHTLSLNGGVNLPMRTRLTGTFSYGLRLQNEDFLAHTLKDSIASDPDLRLPQKGLNGVVQTVLLNLTGVTRPLPPLSLTAHYRFYDLNDDRDVLTFPGHALGDHGPVSREPRRAGQWSYTKQNADLGGRWTFSWPVALTLGVGWEQWDRNEHREVPESNEFFGKAAVDLNPFDWLQARITYRPSLRRIELYNTHAHLAHTVEEDAAAATQGQSVLLRKYDEGERDRQRVDASFTITPVDQLSFMPIFSWRLDDYIDSRLGVQSATSWSAGMDVAWTPSERLSLSAGYLYEKIRQQMRSRSRPVIGGFGIDFLDYDWVSQSTDTVHTVHGGLRATLIPKALDYFLNASYAYALGRVETSNPLEPTSSTLANRITARAKVWPSFEDSLVRLETGVKYMFAKNWSANLRYTFEMWEKQDWRTDSLNPFVPAVNSIFLGNDARDYTAHILTATLGFRFK